jgi:hypothetical protein
LGRLPNWKNCLAGELMADDWRKGLRDTIDRDVARRHSAAEPSLAPSGASLKPPRKPAGEFLRSHLGTLTLKDLAYLGGLVFTAVTWAQSRASRDDVEAARQKCVESASIAITAALVPVPPRFKAIEKRQARNDQRWDRLDSWHARAFGSPFKTPPPKFGPKAEARGEVRYEDEEEE